jgi:hypothetical protein
LFFFRRIESEASFFSFSSDESSLSLLFFQASAVSLARFFFRVSNALWKKPEEQHPFVEKTARKA